MDKLPKTAEYIQRIVELDMDFRLRRLEWSIQEIKNSGEPLVKWRLIKKAGIRESS